MPNGVSRETYEHLPVDDKLNILFDYIQRLYDISTEADNRMIELCDKRHAEILNEINRLDRKKVVNAAASAGGGFVGGIAAAWMYIKSIIPGGP